MSKSASPFAGIKITDQTALGDRGTDQQLFTPTPRRQPASPTKTAAPAKIQQPSNLPRKEGSQEPRKVGTQVPAQPAVSVTPKLSPAEDRPTFDIHDPATEKNSYMFSQDELWALRDVESELERTYRIEVSKYNIVRLGLHMLLEDYRRDNRNSFLVRRLGLKEK